jgi:hypothetical protein
MAAGLCYPRPSLLNLFYVEGIISLPAASEPSALFSPDGSPLPAPDPANLSSSIKINVFHQPTLEGQSHAVENLSECLLK